MNVLDRLQTLFGRAEPPPELPLSDEPPLGSIARDIENFNWASLLDDMDRFSSSFNDRRDRPPS